MVSLTYSVLFARDTHSVSFAHHALSLAWIFGCKINLILSLLLSNYFSAEALHGRFKPRTNVYGRVINPQVYT